MFKKKDKVTKYWLDKLECEYGLYVQTLSAYLIPYKVVVCGAYDSSWCEREYFYDSKNRTLKAFITLPEIVEWAEKQKNKENK